MGEISKLLEEHFREPWDSFIFMKALERYMASIIRKYGIGDMEGWRRFL